LPRSVPIPSSRRFSRSRRVARVTTTEASMIASCRVHTALPPDVGGPPASVDERFGALVYQGVVEGKSG
jgi:hypothetical protein